MSVTQTAIVEGASATPGRMSRYRWRVCALLFAATTLNYLDRQVFGVLAPDLQKSIGWNEVEYGYLVTAFQAAYAIGLLFAGGIIDRVGTRIGYAIAISIWSIAAMSHAAASSLLSFGFSRFLLGLGESGNFPAAIKTVAEWFPRKERALATGIFNSGSNVGAILAPLTVPFVAARFGWQAAFLFTGFFSALWLVVWLRNYRPPEHHPSISREELHYIQSAPAAPAVKIPWARLMQHRQAWAFIAGKFLTDPIWWFLLFWLPKFLNSQHGLTLTKLGPPLVVIYVMADVGSIGGGWLAAALLARGWSPNKARKTAMLICAVLVTPIVLVSQVGDLWAAVALIGLAAAAHQGWSANLYTLTSDLFPQHAVGSVVGLGGFGGAIGGMLIATVTGFLLQVTGSYTPMFVLAGSIYLIALLIIHVLTPRLEAAMQPA